MKKEKKYSISVDFDGVIHQYNKKWMGYSVIPDPPVAGAIEWLHEMIQEFHVFIHSCRCRTRQGRRAIRSYIQDHAEGMWESTTDTYGLETIMCVYHKPAALVYVDDRGFRFEGTFPSKYDIHNRLIPMCERKDKNV